MKMYSKRKYSLLDYDSILYEDFWIEEITSGKLLGILLDKNLSWDNQVDKIYMLFTGCEVRRARDVFKTEGTVFLIRTDAAGK